MKMSWAQFKDKEIKWSEEKDQQLVRTRNFSFADVVAAVEDGRNILDIFPHPLKDKYPNQIVLIVRINNYAVVVPFVPEDDTIFLKTAYHNRESTQRYLSTKKNI